MDDNTNIQNFWTHLNAVFSGPGNGPVSQGFSRSTINQANYHSLSSPSRAFPDYARSFAPNASFYQGEQSAGRSSGSHYLDQMLGSIQQQDPSARMVTNPAGQQVIRVTREGRQGEKQYDLWAHPQTNQFFAGAPGGRMFGITDSVDWQGNITSAQSNLNALLGTRTSRQWNEFLLGRLSGTAVHPDQFTPQNLVKYRDMIAMEPRKNEAGARIPNYASDVSDLQKQIVDKNAGLQTFYSGSGSHLRRTESAVSSAFYQGEAGYYGNTPKHERESGVAATPQMYYAPGAPMPQVTLPGRAAGSLGPNVGYRVNFAFSQTGLGIAEGEAQVRSNFGYLGTTSYSPVDPSRINLQPGDTWTANNHRLTGIGINNNPIGNMNEIAGIPRSEMGSRHAGSYEGLVQDSKGGMFARFTKYVSAPLASYKNYMKATGRAVTPESLPEHVDALATAPSGKRFGRMAMDAWMMDAGTTDVLQQRFMEHATSKKWGLSQSEALEAFNGGVFGGRGADIAMSAAMGWANRMDVGEGEVGWRRMTTTRTISEDQFRMWEGKFHADKTPFLSNARRLSTGGYRADVTEYMNMMSVFMNPREELGKGSHLFKAEELSNMARNAPDVYKNLAMRAGRGEFFNPAQEVVQAAVANRSWSRAAEMNLLDASQLNFSGALAAAQNILGEGAAETDIHRETFRQLQEMHGNQMLRVGDTVLPSFRSLASHFTEDENGKPINNIAQKAFNALARASDVETVRGLGGDAGEQIAARNIAASEALASLNELANKGSILEKATGMNVEGFSGAAHAIPGLPMNVAVATEAGYRNQIRNLPEEEQRAYMEAFKRGEGRMFAQMWPEANAAAHGVTLRAMPLEMLKNMEGFGNIELDDRSFGMAPELAMRMSKDFDADSAFAAIVDPRSKAVSARDILRLEGMGFGGERQKQREEVGVRANIKKFINSLMPKTSTMDELQKGYDEALTAKGQMGPNYDIFRRELYEFGSNVIEGSGLSAAKQRGLRESLSAFAQLPYQRALDMEPIKDESILRVAEAARSLSADSSGNPSKMNPVFWHQKQGDFKDPQFEKVKEVTGFARESAKLGLGYGSGFTDDPAYNKMVSYLAQAALPPSLATQRGSRSEMEAFIKDFHKSGNFNEEALQKITGQSINEWYYGMQGQEQAVLPAFLSGTAFARAQDKQEGKGNIGFTKLQTLPGNVAANVERVRGIKAFAGATRKAGSLDEAIENAQKLGPMASNFRPLSDAMQNILGSDAQRTIAEMRGESFAHDASPIPDEVPASNELNAMWGAPAGGGGAGSPPTPPSAPAAPPADDGGGGDSSSSGASVTNNNTVYKLNPAYLPTAKAINTQLEMLGGRRDDFIAMAQQFRGARSYEDQVRLAMNNKNLVQQGTQLYNNLRRADSGVTLNQNMGAPIPEGVAELFGVGGAAFKALHEDDQLGMAMAALTRQNEIAKFEGGIRRGITRMDGGDKAGLSASFASVSQFIDEFQKLGEAMQEGTKITKEQAKTIREFGGDIDKLGDSLTKAQKAGLSEFVGPDGGVVPLSEAEKALQRTQTPQIEALRAAALQEQMTSGYSLKDRLAQYRSLDEDTQAMMRSDVMYGSGKGARRKFNEELGAWNRGQESMLDDTFIGKLAGELYGRGGSSLIKGASLAGRTWERMSSPGFIWGAHAIRSVAIDPVLGAMQGYEQEAAQRELSLAASGNIPIGELTGGALGKMQSRRAMMEESQYAFGRQAYQAWSPWLYGGAGNVGAGPIGTAAAIGGPALGAAAILGMTPLSALALPAAGVLGLAGAAGYISSNTTNYAAMGRPASLEGAAGNWGMGLEMLLTGSTPERISRWQLSGTLASQASKWAQGGVNVNDLMDKGKDFGSYGYKTLQDAFTRSDVLAAGYETWRSDMAGRGITSELAGNVFSQWSRYNFGTAPDIGTAINMAGLSMAGIDVNSLTEAAASAYGYNPTNLLGRQKLQSQYIANLSSVENPLRTSNEENFRLSIAGALNPARANAGLPLYTSSSADLINRYQNYSQYQIDAAMRNDLARSEYSAIPGVVGTGRFDRIDALINTNQLRAATQLMNAPDISAQVQQNLSNRQILQGSVVGDFGTAMGNIDNLAFTRPGAIPMAQQMLESYYTAGGRQGARVSNVISGLAGTADANNVNLMQMVADEMYRGSPEDLGALSEQVMNLIGGGSLSADVLQSRYASRGMRRSLNIGRATVGRGAVGANNVAFNRMVSDPVRGAQFMSMDSTTNALALLGISSSGAESAIMNNLMANNTAAAQQQIQNYGSVGQMAQGWSAYNTSPMQISSNVSFMTGLSGQQFNAAQQILGGNMLAVSANMGLAQRMFGASIMPFAPINTQTGQDVFFSPRGNQQNFNMAMGAFRNWFAGSDFARQGVNIDMGALEAGGTQGIQAQVMKLQAASIGAGVAMQKYVRNTGMALNTGGGTIADGTGFMVGGDGLAGAARMFGQQGFNLMTGNGMGFWQIEDRMTQMGRDQQMFNWQQQERQLNIGATNFDLQAKQFYERWDLANNKFNYNTNYQRQEMGIGRGISLTQRAWRGEDMAYDRDRAELEFGWQMEDYDRNIRYTRGRERVDMLRQKGRDVTRFSMEQGRRDIQEDRVETQNKWEDEKFQRERQHFEQTVNFQREEMDMQKRHFEERRALDKEQLDMQRENFEKQKAWTKEQWALEDQKRLLERQHAQFQLEMQNRIADASAGNAAKINELQNTAQLASQFLSEVITRFKTLAEQGKMGGGGIIGAVSNIVQGGQNLWNFFQSATGSGSTTSKPSSGSGGASEALTEQLSFIQQETAEKRQAYQETLRDIAAHREAWKQVFSQNAKLLNDQAGADVRNHSRRMAQASELGALEVQTFGRLKDEVSNIANVVLNLANSQGQLKTGVDSLNASMIEVSKNFVTTAVTATTFTNNLAASRTQMVSFATESDRFKIKMTEIVNKLKEANTILNAPPPPNNGGGPQVDQFYMGGFVPSFAAGGYTGSGMKYQAAGVVHGGEWVVPQSGSLVVRGGDNLAHEYLRSIDAKLQKIIDMGPGRVAATIYTKEESIDTRHINDAAYRKIK